MALRKYFEFREAYYDKRLIRVEIYDNNYYGASSEGVLSEPADQLTIDIDDETLESPIRGSSYEIKVYEETEGEYDFTWITDAKRCEVYVYADSIIKWHGFIQPELHGAPHTSVPRQLTITAVDGLALLKNYYHEYKLKNNLAIDKLSIMSYIIYGLTEISPKNVGLYLYDNIYIYENNQTQTQDDSPWVQLYLKQTAFLSEDEDTDETFQSYYDIFEAILSRFHAYIRYTGDGFKIVQINTQKEESTNGRKRYITGQTVESTTFEGTKYIQRLHSDETRYFWLDGSQYKEIEPGWKTFTIKQDYQLRDTILPNIYELVSTSADEIYIISDDGETLAIRSKAYNRAERANKKDYIKFVMADVDESKLFGISVDLSESYTGSFGTANLALVIVESDSTEHFLKSGGEWTTTKTFFHLSSDSETSYESVIGLPCAGELQLRIYLDVPYRRSTGYDPSNTTSYGRGPINYYFNYLETNIQFLYYTEISESLEEVTTLNENNNSEESLETAIGDIDFDNYINYIYNGAIYYSTDGSNFHPTGSWTIYGKGDDATLNELIADEYGGNHLYPINKIEGKVSGVLDPIIPIEEAGDKRYQLLSADVDLHLCEWDIVMMEIGNSLTSAEVLLELNEDTINVNLEEDASGEGFIMLNDNN